MHRILVTLMLVAGLAGCASNGQQAKVMAGANGRNDNPAAANQPVVAPGVHFGGGDGSSMDQAVTVLGAVERTGVDAEYAWLHVHFPGYDHMQQGLLNKDGKYYDEMRFSTPDGAQHTIYFDITDYFGKM